jgi:multiple sugar transport system substrate-binding protein
LLSNPLFDAAVMTRRRALAVAGSLALPAAAGACGGGDDDVKPPGPVRVVFKHHPLGDPAAFRHLIASFESAHPGVVVSPQLLPNAPGAVHQYLLTSLEGRTREFDVFLADVIWVAELARAGWVADLSGMYPAERIRRDFLPGPASSVLVQGGTFAVPWYSDVGVFYHRTDLVPQAPRTYAELIDAAPSVGRRRSLHGYVWQGLQSEALVCNAYETIWGFGGPPERPDQVELDTEAARSALELMRTLLVSGVSPPSVTSMGEEESRRVFQAGAAVFMRNWPYAWAELQGKGSPVRGRVGISLLPTARGGPGHGALGGFNLALNAYTPRWKREAALALIAHLSSPEANLMLAVSYGRLPARRSAYTDPRLVAAAPAVATLLPAVERALPRPVTPYYPMIDDALAAELSAAITGIRSPAAALARAQAQVDHLMREVR